MVSAIPQNDSEQSTNSAIMTLPTMHRKHATQPTKLRRSFRKIVDKIAIQLLARDLSMRQHRTHLLPQQITLQAE